MISNSTARSQLQATLNGFQLPPNAESMSVQEIKKPLARMARGMGQQAVDHSTGLPNDERKGFVDLAKANMQNRIDTYRSSKNWCWRLMNPPRNFSYLTLIVEHPAIDAKILPRRDAWITDRPNTPALFTDDW